MFRNLVSHRISLSIFLALVIVECLSLLGFVFAPAAVPLFVLVVAGVLALSIWRLEFGVSALIAELVIGGKGYLFSFELGEYSVSVRLGIFVVVLIVWLIRFFRGSYRSFFSSPLLKPWLALIAALAVGVMVALLQGNERRLLFLDANGYLYFAILPVLVGVIGSRSEIRRQLSVLTGALYALTLKTLFVLFYFSHETTTGALRLVYKWIRDTGVGEITQLDFNFFRVFFQSHIFLVLILCILLAVWALKRPSGRKESAMVFVAAVLIFSAYLMSMSRSIWLGSAIGFISFVIYLYSHVHIGMLKLLRMFGALVLVVLSSLLLLTAIVNMPLPGGDGGGGSAAELIRERITSGDEEVAVSSRLKLLRPLAQKVTSRPLVGHGFGATLTYETDDPRTIETVGKSYTTYAFEWGYLDFLMKFGVVGLIGFGYFLWSVLRLGVRALRSSKSDDVPLVAGVLFAYVALLAIHATTPYLNHPLGIGYLGLVVAVFLRYMQRTSHEHSANS